MDKLKPEQKLIKLVFKNILYDKEQEKIGNLLKDNSIDWSAFNDLINYHGISPLIHASIKPYLHLLPDDIKQLLNNRFWNSLKKNLIYEQEYKTIYEIFCKKGVDLVPIKGVAFLHDIYNGHFARSLNDIDLLIKEGDYKKAVKILESIGYIKKLEGMKEEYWLIKQCHVAFIKRNEQSFPIVLDLHFRLDFKRNNKTILDFDWSRNRELNIDNDKIKVLSIEDTLFSLVLHQRRYGPALSLKYVLDVALLFKKYKEKFNWAYIYAECKKNKLFSCLYFLLLQETLFLEDKDMVNIIEGDLFPISRKKKNIMRKFISKELSSYYLHKDIKKNYLKVHFLLYDGYLEPAKYIINIPLEQFSKYYDLKPYVLKTKILYRLRFLYFLVSFLKNALKSSLSLDR